MRYLLIIPFLLFVGCSTKVFEPKRVETKNLRVKSLDKILSAYTKDTLTFKEVKGVFSKKTLFYDENGNILGEFKKINKDLAVNGRKMLVISAKKTYNLPFLIFSATKKGNLVAVVFENGKYGLFDIRTKKIKFVYDSDSVLSVKYLHATPLFYKDLILYPLLSGNVAVVDAKEGQFIRYLNISQQQFNDNVIFLKIVNNQLFMATPSRLILFNPNFLIDYKADIKHIIDYKGFIYIFTTDGKIIKLDSNLKEIKKIDLPFASFFAPTICKGNIYTVEKEGYLIKITPDLNITIYDGNNFDTSAYGELKIKGCRIYNDDKVFMIE
jgi:hypothetical protein